MKVKIYTTPTCPYCKLAKSYMDEQGVAYEEIDVAANTDAAQEMVKVSGQMGVPVIMVDEQVIVGWNKTALEEALGAKKAAAA
jgi:alkyl hydroperoxide reductase subunit F